MMMEFRRHMFIRERCVPCDEENFESSEDALKDCGRIGNVRVTPSYSEGMENNSENSFHPINELGRNATSIPMTVFRSHNHPQNNQNRDIQCLKCEDPTSNDPELLSSFTANCSATDTSCNDRNLFDKVSQWLWCYPQCILSERFRSFQYSTCCNNSLDVNLGSGSVQTNTDNINLLQSPSVRFSAQTYNCPPPTSVNSAVFNETYMTNNSDIPSAPPPSLSSSFNEQEDPLITLPLSNSKRQGEPLIASNLSNSNSSDWPFLTSTRRSLFPEYKADLWTTARSFSNVEEVSLDWDNYEPHFGIHVIRHQQQTADGVILSNVGHLV